MSTPSQTPSGARLTRSHTLPPTPASSLPATSVAGAPASSPLSSAESQASVVNSSISQNAAPRPTLLIQAPAPLGNLHAATAGPPAAALVPPPNESISRSRQAIADAHWDSLLASYGDDDLVLSRSMTVPTPPAVPSPQIAEAAPAPAPARGKGKAPALPAPIPPTPAAAGPSLTPTMTDFHIQRIGITDISAADTVATKKFGNDREGRETRVRQNTLVNHYAHHLANAERRYRDTVDTMGGLQAHLTALNTDVAALQNGGAPEGVIPAVIEELTLAQNNNAAVIMDLQSNVRSNHAQIVQDGARLQELERRTAEILQNQGLMQNSIDTLINMVRSGALLSTSLPPPPSSSSLLPTPVMSLSAPPAPQASVLPPAPTLPAPPLPPALPALPPPAPVVPPAPVNFDPNHWSMPSAIAAPPSIPMASVAPVGLPQGLPPPPPSGPPPAAQPVARSSFPAAAAPPANKKARNSFTPAPGSVTVTVTNITWGTNITGEVRATVQTLLGTAADSVVAAPHFRAHRGLNVVIPMAHFSVASRDWAAWFCESWNTLAPSSTWPSSRATYELVPL
ncbi:hypothetical protein ARMSODRAFT_947370, partial [Armillaria solidipes]